MNDNDPRANQLTRRTFFAAAAARRAATDGPLAVAADEPASLEATGVSEIAEIGHPLDALTASSARNSTGSNLAAKANGHGRCPGRANRRGLPGCQATFEFATATDRTHWHETAWVDVTAESDFTTTSRYRACSPPPSITTRSIRPPGRRTEICPAFGEVRTAPAASDPSNLTFCVMTCQGYPDRDHDEGTYLSLDAGPGSSSLAGTSYYDNDNPRAGCARLHWERCSAAAASGAAAQARTAQDDHDTLKTIRGGQQVRPLSFDEGQRSFASRRR
jgi:hypothetical protein